MITSLSRWSSRPSLFSLSWDLEVLALVFSSVFSPERTRLTASSLDSCRTNSRSPFSYLYQNFTSETGLRQADKDTLWRQHLAMAWSISLVFSGSWPQTIRTGFTARGSPLTSSTTSMAFWRKAILESLSWRWQQKSVMKIHCQAGSGSENLPERSDNCNRRTFLLQPTGNFMKYVNRHRRALMHLLSKILSLKYTYINHQ